jgi:hypothetical protein
VSDDELDIGEAVDFITAERPGLAEDDVWAVLTELGAPPAASAEGLALDIVAASRPEVARRDAKVIIREWRAYAALAVERDYEDEEL